MIGDLYVRWAIRRDMPEILQIESSVFKNPWTEDEFYAVLKQRNCIGMVVDSGPNIVGFMVYELHKTNLEVLNFAVHPSVWRQGIGTMMVQKLEKKLAPKRRASIAAVVRETNLDAHSDTDEDGYADPESEKVAK